MITINNKTKVQIIKFFLKVKAISVSEKTVKNKILGCKL
jgi:hypothetical protein